ncbi:MAG: peptidase S8 [Candidatus Eisenbacteria bacterium]|uniref:Peptidase S8 n=1 Tax=Eiseniibacteriota bacterium TaxID=2212470 RepID=A0A538UBN1_UNCEI|nr:MAG: peptidase S8 [Candidatus Eisenbacteria bacterium]
MKRFVRALGLIAIIIATTAGVARSQDSVDLSQSDGAIATADGKQIWFVELLNPPTTDGGDLGTILTEQSTFRTSATQAGVRYNEKYAFQNLWNGLSIAVDPKDLGKLRRMSSIGALYPVTTITLPNDDTVNEPELATALKMTGADVAHSQLGLTGAGVKVGIIDTGQDYDHPDLGGDGVQRTNSHVFPTARAVTGYDFVGDAWAPGGTPVPDAYPDDCNGHGTHVSGIVGANGAVVGVAPGVTFGVYKVFGCGTSTASDVMIAAMERALADGMQVINMSIGAAMQWPSYPTAAATKRLVDHGVVVVCSAGNDQNIGLYASAAPAVGEKAISVASFDNIAFNQSAFTVSPDDHPIGYNPAASGPAIPVSGTFPLVRTGTTSSAADGCAAFAPGSLSGKVALIRRGTCGFYNKAINAQNAGAVGVILYNNAGGQLNPSVAGSPPVTIPVVGITLADGVLLDSRIQAGPVSITWTGGSVSIPNVTGGFISSFSSWGVSPDLSTKPDIGAPGGLIRSSVPIEQGSYAVFSGTSMSSPHVAGGVALLLEAHPNTPPNTVRDILQNSAEPHGLSPANPGLLASVHLQGAGMLNIPGAVLANTRIQPGKLSLGETSGGSVTQTLTISNNSDHDISYALGHSPALATGPNTFTVALFNAPSVVSFSANPVFVPAGGSAPVDVTVAPSAGLADRSIFSGYIDVTPDDGSPEYDVPYTGFKGDYQSIPVLTPTASGFPWLARQVGTSLFKQNAGATFSLTGVDFPIIVFHLDHAISLFTVEAFDAVTGKSWHLIDRERDIRRSTGPNSFFTLAWDGTTFHGNAQDVVPNGNYVIKLSIVKALGSEANPGDVETFTSPQFFLARPDISLESFSVSQNSVAAGDQVTLSATVRNTKIDPKPNVHVSFFDGDALLGESFVDLAAGETRSVESAWTVGTDPTHHLKVKVDPLPTEEIVANNEIDVDVNLGEAIVGVGAGAHVLAFAPARPNPSSGAVNLGFSLPKSGPVSLDVFDVTGRRLKTWRWTNLEAGEHSIAWDGKTESGRMAPTGTVLLRLNAMGRSLTQKAVRIQ